MPWWCGLCKVKMGVAGVCVQGSLVTLPEDMVAEESVIEDVASECELTVTTLIGRHSLNYTRQNL